MSKIIAKVLDFDYHLPEHSDRYFQEYPVYKFVSEKAKNIGHHQTTFLKKAAGAVAINAVAEQFIQNENRGYCNADRHKSQLIGNLQRLDTGELPELSEYLGVFHGLVYDESEDIFIGQKPTVRIKPRALEIVLSTVILLEIEVELERLKMYLVHGVDREEWIELIGWKIEEEREAVSILVELKLGCNREA